MKLLIDLIKQEYGVAECEHLIGPDPCAKLDRLTETIVLESGLWRVRDVCAECRDDALSHPIGKLNNRL
jgi:hypothetical protein